MSNSNFNPQNTPCVPEVEIIVFPRKKNGIFDLNLPATSSAESNKIGHFSKVSKRIPVDGVIYTFSQRKATGLGSLK